MADMVMDSSSCSVGRMDRRAAPSQGENLLHRSSIRRWNREDRFAVIRVLIVLVPLSDPFLL